MKDNIDDILIENLSDENEQGIDDVGIERKSFRNDLKFYAKFKNPNED